MTELNPKPEGIERALGLLALKLGAIPALSSLVPFGLAGLGVGGALHGGPLS